jgi:hypothetical protein
MVRALTDFKDWFSPMIVKELRQGTRTRMFSFAFILLQAALILVLLTSLASDRSSSTGASIGFWFCVVITFFVVMPLRGFGAIANEAKMQTLEMVVLTRLSASKIIFGKWAALFSQTLLVASALLPFVVIRYFLGGIDLANEALWLLILVIISGTLTAITVGLSAQPSFLLRGAIAVAIMIGGLSFAGGGVSDLMRHGGSMVSDPDFWKFFAAFVTTAIFASYYVLAMGASHFAPISENHATRKRLSTLVYMAVMGVLYWFDVPGELVLGISGVILTIVVIDSLTERPAPVASIYIPFVKRGTLGRLFGKVFYPGWQSGLLFSGIVVGVFVALFIEEVGSLDEDELAGITSAMGMIIFPAAITQLFFQRHGNPFGLYIMIALLALALVGLVAGIDDSQESSILWFFAMIPTACMFIAGNNYRYDSDGTILVVSSVVTLVWLLILLVKAIGIFRQIHRLENVVVDLVAKEKQQIDQDKT